MMQFAWLIPLFPLLAFIVLLAFGRQLKASSAYVGILATVASFVIAVLVLLQRLGDGAENEHVWIDWLNVGQLSISMGFEVNQLNAMMLVIVTLVSMLVNLYSIGYMHGDERISVFYSYLALFTFSMLGLVLSPNLLQVYIFWELVGVCSFLLVGFWFFKPEAKAAAKKAFIVTRIGDVGLFIAIILIFWQVGSFEYDVVFSAVTNGDIAGWMVTLIAILIFVGAVGKSGQFPLHTWLPDAMEGPTPVSALIHAATMVAAGVYLVARTFPLFEASETAMLTVAVVGGFTAIFAASIGLVQNDIKRVLAYSTVSQLGYMMLALGAAGYVAGVFHLMTHAFFKALLFLAAGSVIHALHHEQDINRMGGLFKHMKITGTVFLIGCLAIAGIPPFSGFFSKDEILLSVYENGNYFLFILAVIAAFFTAFYMFRLFFLVFTGDNRSEVKVPHESPSVMTLPMIILAALTVIVGFVQTPWNHGFGEWLTGHGEIASAHPDGPMWIMLLALLVSLAGLGLAYMMYKKKSIARDFLAKPMPKLYQLLFNKYYVDEAYNYSFVTGLKGSSVGLAAFDKYVVGGIVGLVAYLTQAIGSFGQRLQNGLLQNYGLMMLWGLVIIIIGYAAGRY